MPDDPPIGRLHFLTDFHFQQRYGHAQLAALAIQGGVDVVQFREKRGTTRSKLFELAGTVEVCAELGATLLVDDDLALAQAVDADGIHLGLDDLPIADARRVLSNDKIIGATASTVAEARRAQAAGADYVGFGPVFPTSSKSSPMPVRGLNGLAACCEAVDIPVIAIAGISPDSVDAIVAAGAHGIAVMTAISTSKDVASAAAAFRDALDKALS